MGEEVKRKKNTEEEEGGEEEEEEQERAHLRSLQQKIARILDDVKPSNATHIRKLKEISALRSNSRSPPQFASAFFKTLTPLFQIQRRTASSERVARFASAFATARTSDAFLEEFLRFLVAASAAANKTARFRACQLISEIVMRLPDDAEVSNELWDEVIECMKLRALDKVPAIRTFAIRALSRFANDTEDTDVLDLFLEALPLEQNAEVRKTIVLALPPFNATSQAIIDCTLDVSESVRKAAYFVLANKFPLQSLSIKQRTVILNRGLADRSEAVSKECLNLMKDKWFSKCCNGDPVELLKYLDVETYESVGESVLETLLKDGLVKLRDGQSIRQYISSASSENEGETVEPSSIQLMEPELALYWKIACRHLQREAQAKGSDAAATMGTEAAVYAAEATDNNDLLDTILPATVSDYVVLVKAHIDAGANYRFSSQQLLLLGEMLDFSDSTSRKVGGALVQDLLHMPLDHEVDDEGNKVVIGDGINLGGDKDWADAVSCLARKVHAAAGEFEQVVLGVVEELARPCRERTADFMQWMHSLAVTGLLLENAKSFHWLQGKAIEPAELLQSLLLPGGEIIIDALESRSGVHLSKAKHIHFDVQRVAIRCLGLFGLLEKKPSEDLLKQLKISFAKGPPAIGTLACKALIDLFMWHGPQELDRAVELEDSASQIEDGMGFNLAEFDVDEILNIKLIDLLYAGLNQDDWGKPAEIDENETVHAVIGEGFAKILLLGKNYPSIPASLLPLLFQKLVIAYFSYETKDLPRLKQCLSVFFEHYPSLTANNKASTRKSYKYMSKAFIPVMRAMWPSINGNPGGSPVMVSNMRKRATQASRFMLQMMQAPLYSRQTETENDNGSMEASEVVDNSLQPPLECAEEGLAIRIAAEVISFGAKKSAAERAYIAALCRILVLLQFRVSEQGAIKLMQRLLNRVAESASAEKDVVKDLKLMAERLKSVDKRPDEVLLEDEANAILGSLELDLNLDVDTLAGVPQTPAPRRTNKPSRPRRKTRNDDSSDDEVSSASICRTIPATIGSRSQRASKTAALTKITTNTAVKIDEYDDEGEESSEVISEEDSDDSALDCE
ncbi:hypothetical protein Tsubulata_021465 [Turnera subulata]|uniref:Nuclear condensin complex subunit 3 C-terminal domain-containing protein n=1 Tax=Turnera subulata TaxID=218843 RepID=A0A9Q0FWT2_9ROSI|nr:hypothetical protein Tsubulata_021465 [Turnera subulata]